LGHLGGVMNWLNKRVLRFLVSEDGPTAVEYAVMLALIVTVCLTAISTLGTKTSSTFNTLAGSLPS
jgi:pilus assembly protein Flp/PilA